mmetsp:Transcript_13102/g.34040  ORF Transcript_13102/g.34040 Transcript_13102/m.34040 type:complete len:205 (+) Transcript_13102:269-883(+)
MDLVVQLRSRVRLHDGPRALVLDQESTLGDAHVAHLAPILTPRVADDPEEAIRGVGAPADNGDDVVDTRTLGLDDAGLVVEEGHGVDAAGDGTAVVDLLHHGIGTADGAVVGDGDVRVGGEAGARATLLGEAAARASDVQSLAGAVHVWAEALLGVRGTCEVGLRALVGNAIALVRDLLQPLVRAVDTASIAAAHASAIQQVLH